MPLYDITPTIRPKLGVWPGDTPVSREVLLEIEKGATVTLSTLRATVHLGAHADAPNHYGAGERAMEACDLRRYLGPCQLLRLNVDRGKRIPPAAITQPIVAERVLLSTNTFLDPENWNHDFAALSVELIDVLHAQGVKLIGLDSPSVDLFDSKDLPAHKRILSYDISILEGLILRNVPEGLYELIALPLPLEGFDASPVRAVLRTMA